MPGKLSQKQFHSICNELASKDADLKCIIETHGYPQMGSRANTYESLVHLFLSCYICVFNEYSGYDFQYVYAYQMGRATICHRF